MKSIVVTVTPPSSAASEADVSNERFEHLNESGNFHDRHCTELQQLVVGLHRIAQNSKSESTGSVVHREEEDSSSAKKPDAPQPKTGKRAVKTFDSREEKLRKIFALCDTSVGKDAGDGEIRKRELIVAVKKHEHIAEFFGLPKKFLKDDETQALASFFQGVDKDGDGQMTFEELWAWDVKRREKKKQAGASPTEVAKRLLRCMESIIQKQRRIYQQRMLQNLFFKHTGSGQHQISRTSASESQNQAPGVGRLIDAFNNHDLGAMKELEMFEYNGLMTPRTRAKQEYWAIYHADTAKLEIPSAAHEKLPLLHSTRNTRRVIKELKAEAKALKERHQEKNLQRCSPQEWDPEIHKAMGISKSVFQRSSRRISKGKALVPLRRPAIRAKGYKEIYAQRAKKIGFGSSVYTRDEDSDFADSNSRRTSRTSALDESGTSSDSGSEALSGLDDGRQGLDTIADEPDSETQVEVKESRNSTKEDPEEIEVEEAEGQEVDMKVPKPPPWKVNVKGGKLGGGISLGALPMGIGGTALLEELKEQLTPRTKKRMTVSVRRMSTAYSIPTFMSSSKEVLYGAVESGINPPEEQRDDDAEDNGEGGDETFGVSLRGSAKLARGSSLGETLRSSMSGTLKSFGKNSTGKLNITLSKQKPGRFPGASVWQMYGEAKSAQEIGVTPQHAYFQEFRKMRVLPKIPRFLTGMANASEIPPHPPTGLTDTDLVATKSALIRYPASVRSLDLSGSSSVSGQCIRDFWDGLPARTTRELISINLSGMRLGTESLRHFQDLIYERRFACLQILNFDGVPVPDHAWHMFCRALVALGSLNELSLQNTRLGAAQQQSCLEVAWLVQSHPKLKKLDISNNFFYFQGLQALADSLAKSSVLRELCLAQNSSGKTPESGFSGISAMESFCDCLVNNKGLERLDLQGCGLTGAVDVVLYEALKEHPRICSLNLSDNPHGYQGLRCLVHLLVSPTSLIDSCDVRDVRDSIGCFPSTPIFNFCNPSGSYKLDLARPMNRVVLSLLLQVRDKHGGDEFFSEVTLDNHPVKAAQASPLGEACEKTSRGWKIAREGRLSFCCTLPSSPEHDASKTKSKGALLERDAESQTWKEFVCRAELERKVSFGRRAVNMRRFSVIAEMLRQLENAAEQELLIRALSSDLLLKVCHLKWLIEVTPPDFAKSIGEHLWSTLSCPVVFDLFQIMSAGRSSPTELHNSPHVMRSFFFNPLNPTGSYQLQLELPSSHSLGLRVLVINSWEKKLAEERGLSVDTSQHGGHWGIRNLRYQNGMVLRYTDSFQLPIEGTLSFDYTSVLRLDPLVTQATGDEVTESLLHCLSNNRAQPADKVWALRSVSHMLTLNAEQITTLLPVISATKFGIRHRDLEQLARSDVFVSLFPRCLDVPNLVADQICCNEELFTPKERASILSRLGWLNAFDPLSCGGGKSYLLNLSIHEERQLCSFLVQLASQKGAEDLQKVSWSGHVPQEGNPESSFVVPSKWLTGVPHEGEFKCQYGLKTRGTRVCAAVEEMLEPRKKLAAEFFGFLY